LQGVKLGVFASMDLPPLFPYMEMGDDVFEDGGVIDNLPSCSRLRRSIHSHAVVGLAVFALVRALQDAA
jgi:predicted acylesterase/phospholipase RssA